MTNERRKALLTLAGTLIIGILLGLLLPGLFHKMKGRNSAGYGREKTGMDHKREWFTGTINRIVQPDSSQANRIAPITKWAAAKIDSIETSSNNGLAAVL